MNIQCVCDHNYKFTSVVARWPGGKHDNAILHESHLYEAHESGRIQGRLLGDAGYALKRWLIVPINAPETPAENRFQR